MDQQQIIKLLQDEIAKVDKPKNRINYQQFFKEKLAEPTGLRTGLLREISNSSFREVKALPIGELLNLCDALLRSGRRYSGFFAFDWARKAQKHFRQSDFSLFQRWLDRYVDNWGSCDHFCGATIGPLLLLYPELATRTQPWARSRNLWRRRASAVALIVPVKKGMLLDEVFQRADTLLLDKEDMVQKGYGWMLKEASNVFPAEVFAYVLVHKDVMPRTALRYAIEKYPQAKRKEAMQRG